MPDQRLSVFNASAGSGKTFQIAKNFLIRILQNPQAFYTSKLIGLTFTNKAANEMKKRILEILIQTSKGDFPVLMKEVMKEIKPQIEKQKQKKLEDKEYERIIIANSKQRLNEILHQYDDFNLLTIDKLSYKIIRTFAREMEIPYDARIIIKPEEIIDNLIDEIISSLKPGDPLMQNITALALENADNETNWEIKKNFEPVVKMIKNENYRREIEYIKNKNFEDIIRLKKFLLKKIKETESKYLKTGKELREILKDSSEKFQVKKLTDNLSSPKKHKDVKFSSSLINKINKEEFFTAATIKKKSVPEQELIKEKQKQLIPVLKKAYETYEKEHQDYLLYKGILNEINSLIILHELVNKIEAFKERTHSIFINDFNPLIQKQILKNIDQDTPYIYLRLGEKYIHYFLDEFQDTSELQWNNLVPLIREALSKDFSRLIDIENPGTSMIVGDAKQSIYRFRNGKPEIFIDLSDEKLIKGSGNPFYPITGKRIFQLKENWRSDGQIIRFNNEFFSLHKDLLSEEKYKKVYEHVKQELPPSRKSLLDKGYIEIHFEKSLSENNQDYTLPQKIYEIIQDARERGYAYEDICFLYDTHKVSTPVAEFLSARNIPFIAEKSLNLGKSKKVEALMNFLKYLVFQKNSPLFDTLDFLFAYHEIDNKDELLSEAMKNTLPERIFPLLETAGFSLDQKLLYKLDLYDLMVYLIDKFKFNKDSREENYLQSFLDDIHQFSLDNKTGSIAYILHWNKMKDQIEVQGAEKKGAVQFLSVHASKGLEFPVVIYLAKGALLNKHSDKDLDEIVWIPTDEKKMEGFSSLPIKLRELEKIKAYAEIAEKKKNEKKFDNFNRLYVAHTRAGKELYIITSSLSKKSKEVNNFNLLYALYIRQTKEIKKIEAGDIYNYGKKEAYSPVKEKDKREKIKTGTLPFHLWNENPQTHGLKLRTPGFELWQEAKKSAIEYGLEMHDILAKIRNINDWQKNHAKYLAHIKPEDKGRVKSQIEEILFHPELKEYFSDKYRIFTERAILIPSDTKAFVLRRPDRLVLKGKEAVIMDYKTGEKKTKHIKQINEYASLMEEMDYKVKKKILVYSGEKLEIVYA